MVPICRQVVEEESQLRKRELFTLRQAAELEAHASLEFIFVMLISSKSVEDLAVINLFLSQTDAEQIFDLCVSTVLHASRVGCLNRAIDDARALSNLLAEVSAHTVDVLTPRRIKSLRGYATTKHNMQQAVALKAETLPRACSFAALHARGR